MAAMRRLVALIAIATITTVLVPVAALADEPARGHLLVPGDHHLPGETIEVTGYDLDPGVVVSLFLESGAYGIAFGDGTVASGGTLSIHSTIPSNFPLGYATIRASSQGNGNLTTVILVGERAEGPGASSAPAQAAMDGPVDDQVIGLLMAGFGGVMLAVAGLWWWTGRRGKDSQGA